MVVLFLVVTAAGAALVWFREAIAAEDPDTDATFWLIYGLICLVCGVGLLVVHAVAPFLPLRSWVWIVHLVLICGGMTSACCLPMSVALLIFWIKPETRVYFGRSPA